LIDDKYLKEKKVIFIGKQTNLHLS